MKTRPTIALRLCVLPALLLFGVAPNGLAADQVLALNTDFVSSGSVSALTTASPFASQSDLVPTHTDATARVHDGLIYIVNRLGADNIQIVDPGAGYAVVDQFSVGVGTNPQDIAIATSSIGYVSRYETNDLLKINLQTGAEIATISLAEFADADGLCEMHRMHIDDGYLYVQVQRMFRQDWPDPWIPTPPSALVVIDLATDLIVDVDLGTPGNQGIELSGLNPIAPMQRERFGTGLWVGTAGKYGIVDGAGIERVDLASRQTSGMIVGEAALGGDLVDFAQCSPTKAYAVISDAAFNTILYSFDPSTGDNVQEVYNPGGYVLGDILGYPAGTLYVADRDFVTPGVRIYDTATDELVAGPIDTGLPPQELWLLPDSISDAPMEPPTSSWLGSPYPNPSSGEVRVTLAIDPDLPVTVDIFDALGRRIRTTERLVGQTGLVWNGRDDSDRALPTGVYLLRVSIDTDDPNQAVTNAMSQATSIRIVR